VSSTLFSLKHRIPAQFETTLAKLQSSEQQIEELKSQLDDALGTEEILVQLTEKNMALADVRRNLSSIKICLTKDVTEKRRSPTND
jgi:Asp-tRNA(Asn)/Glu-tRNA(Gln) amidotransferase C subunit